VAGQSLPGILNNRGTKVRLNFKSETEELIVATAGATTKLPYASIRKVDDEQIRGHEGYHILALHLGGGDSNKLFLYWIPTQYVRAIKGTLTGNWFL